MNRKAIEAADRLKAGFDTMDFGDFVSDAAEASSSHEALGAPAGSDLTAAFDALVSDRVGRDWGEAMATLRGASERMEAEYHGAAKDGVLRSTGVSGMEYDDAVAAAEAGDPSPLLRLRCAYLDSI